MAEHAIRRDRILMVVLFVILSLLNGSVAEWLNHGADITNSRSAMDSKINPRTVSNLKLKWKFFIGVDLTATPAVSDGVVYVPAWNGILYALNAFSGDLVWKQNLTELTGLRGTSFNNYIVLSRSAPTVVDDLLIVPIYGPAVVIAVTRATGSLIWSTKLESHPRSLIHMSGTAYKGEFYVGVSSLEEAVPADECCYFRGSMLRLDIRSGAILWKTYTLPDNGGTIGGYAGGSLWGSSPSIDLRRRLVYVATGNLYSAPANVTECQDRQNNQTTIPTGPDQCIGPDVNFNSMMAFEMDTGRIRWARQLGGYDVWYLACLNPNSTDCPPGPNVDADFGEAPMMMTVSHNGARRDIAVAVQKSGFAWALDRDTGDIVWSRLAGPGGIEGGGQFGAANDGKRVYTNIVNSYRKSFRLAPSNQTTTTGAWVAMDAGSGEILWSTANPSNETSEAPVSMANGVLFTGSVAPQGPIYGIDAITGKVLWSYDTGATVYGGISISYGCIYLGHGNLRWGPAHPEWTGGKFIFGFCLW